MYLLARAEAAYYNTEHKILEKRSTVLKKQLIGLTLALALALSLAPAAAARPGAFWDVRRADWFAGYVYALADAGIIDGMEPERFVPAGEVTRAQLVKLMAAAVAEDEALQDARAKEAFSDVSAEDWHAPYVNWSAAAGLAEGYPDGTFQPDRSVTRAEAAVFVTRFAAHCDEIRLSDTTRAAPFADAADIPDWAAEAVAQCVRGGIFDGYEDGSFRPGAHMTRAESAAMLSRLLGVAPLAAESLPDCEQPEHIETELDGIPVEALVFPVHGYTGRIVLAQDRLFRVERADSILERAGAYIGANGAFFDMKDLTTYANLVIDGEPARIDNNSTADTPSLVIAENGAVSIEFMRPEQTLTRLHNGAPAVTETETARNREPYDPGGAAREIVVYTALYGETVPAGFARIAVCAPDGTVTALYDDETGTDAVEIPETGFAVAEHGDEAALLTRCETGDTISAGVYYAGASTQNLRAALSCGPTVVKNGRPYGSADTYAAEGFHAPDLVKLSAVRIAVGVRADGRVVFASAKCTMAELSRIMAALGCETAMNLDGGASACLRAGALTVRTPGRSMNTMIVFTID